MLIARRELSRLGKPRWRGASSTRPRARGDTRRSPGRARAADARVSGRFAELVLREEQAVARASAAAEHGSVGPPRPRALVARREVRTPAARAAETPRRLDRARTPARRPPSRSWSRPRRCRAWRAPAGSVRRAPSSSTPEVLEYRGVTVPGPCPGREPGPFFSARFGRSLPVSALGQTPVARPARLRSPERRGRRGPSGQRRGPRPPRSPARLGAFPFLAFRGPVAGVRPARTCTSALPRLARADARPQLGCGAAGAATPVVPDMLPSEGRP